MDQVVGYDPAEKRPPGYPAPTGYTRNTKAPRTLADTDSAQRTVLINLAKANATVIAQRQHAAGLWRGAGPYNSPLYGPGTMGGSVSWLGLLYNADPEDTVGGVPLLVNDILALFAHPADACGDSPNSLVLADGTEVVKGAGTQAPITTRDVPRRVFSWWTTKGQELTKWFVEHLAAEIKDACDNFIAPGTTSVQPLCYPSHWLFDTEASPDPKLYWGWRGVNQIGLFPNMNTSSDARYSTEAVDRIGGTNKTVQALWADRPMGTNLPAFGQDIDQQLAFRQWINRMNLETQGWAMAWAIKEPLEDVFPGVIVCDYDRVLAPNPLRPFAPGVGPTAATEQFNTLSLGLDRQSPQLYARRGARRIDLHLERIHGLLQACDPSVPIIPWIAHPDNEPDRDIDDNFWYGTEEMFLATVEMCCREFGVREFGLWGSPEDKYQNWNAADLPALIAKALLRVADRPSGAWVQALIADQAATTNAFLHAVSR
ncbi:MAG: hypothetical protein SFY96_10345 [Planctomycetota bacterium]|nr:hypothetical protein [Planctomycetota bacterium]